MKFKIFALLLSFSLISCASMKDKNVHIEEAKSEYSYKGHGEIKEFISKKIDQHYELTDEQKTKLKNVVFEGINKNAEIKIKESKLTQLLFDSVLKKDVDIKKVNQIKKSMKELYSQKSKIFTETAMEMKSIIGLNNNQNDLIREFNPIIF